MLQCCCSRACGPRHRETLLGLPAAFCFGLALARAWLLCSGEAYTCLRLICSGAVRSESAVDGREGLYRLPSLRHLGNRLQGPPPMTCSPGHQGVCPALCMEHCGAFLAGWTSVALGLCFSLACCAFLLRNSSAFCMGIAMSAAAPKHSARQLAYQQCILRCIRSLRARRCFTTLPHTSE